MAVKKANKKVRKWESCRETIVRRMKGLGLYRSQYGAAIDRLAELYVQIDELAAEYDECGREAIVEHTNKAGAKNLQMNPIMTAMLQMQTQALAHERELGLTPAAMRRLGEKEKAAEKSPLEAAIEKMSAG